MTTLIREAKTPVYRERDSCKAHMHIQVVQLSNLTKSELRSLLGSWFAAETLSDCVACYHPAAVIGDWLGGCHCSVEQDAGCDCSAVPDLPDVLVWPWAQPHSAGGPAFQEALP